MSTDVRVEPHEDLVKRMGVKRMELMRELRDKNYWRAATIAAYIADEITFHAEMVERHGS